MAESNFARAFRVGIAGPVGSGKTALVDCLSKRLWPVYNLAVVTNDIYTKEDAEFLLRAGMLWSGSTIMLTGKNSRMSVGGWNRSLEVKSRSDLVAGSSQYARVRHPSASVSERGDQRRVAATFSSLAKADMTRSSDLHAR